MPRARPNSLGSNSKRLGTIQGPDGRPLRIPATKDAITAIFMVGPNGEWTDRAVMLLAYAETALERDSLLEIREMRAGRGMGTVSLVRVLEVRVGIERWEGNWGRTVRQILVEPLGDLEEFEGLSAASLRGPNG